MDERRVNAIIAALSAQRNLALNDAALAAGTVADLEAQIADLQQQVTILTGSLKDYQPEKTDDPS